MKLTKRELKAIVRQAVEAVALAQIRSDMLPSRDEREFIINEVVNGVKGS